MKINKTFASLVVLSSFAMVSPSFAEDKLPCAGLGNNFLDAIFDGKSDEEINRAYVDHQSCAMKDINNKLEAKIKQLDALKKSRTPN